MKNPRQLLLHTCCADCALKFLPAINQNNYSIVLYFDNPNIHPRSEYLTRLTALKTITTKQKLALVVADWSPKLWFSAIGNSKDNNNLDRCRSCWKLRLSRTAEKAQEMDIHYFSTTLLTSIYQSRKIISGIGKSLENNDLHFIDIEKPVQTVKTSGFYKQNYCGCIYSLVERYEEKNQT